MDNIKDLDFETENKLEVMILLPYNFFLIKALSTQMNVCITIRAYVNDEKQYWNTNKHWLKFYKREAG